VLLYDSLNLIIIGFTNHIWAVGGDRSEKVKLRGLDYVVYKNCQCAVLLKDKIITCNVFCSY